MKNYILLFILLPYYIFSQSYKVEGYILLVDGNTPENVEVLILDTNYSTLTDNSGYYSLMLPTGTYHLTLQKKGYWTDHIYNVYVSGPTTLNTVTLEVCNEINPFIQPNDSTLAWYGSGDVDGDNEVDWDDYTAMSSMLNDMSDLDGDGISSTEIDKQILSDYLNAIRNYLPGQWNKLQTREERIDWLDKMLTIDLTDTITYRSHSDYPNDYWMCGNFSVQTYINFHGYQFKNDEEKDSVATRYIVNQNCRFNIPLYYRAINSHANNAVIIGDDPLNLYDWAFADQQNYGPVNHLHYLGENWNPPPNSYMKITLIKDPFYSNSGQWVFGVYTLLSFISDSTAILQIRQQDPNLVLSRPTVSIENNDYDTVANNFLLGQNFPNPFNPTTTIHYSLPEESAVTIIIYDLIGRKINELISLKQLSGAHSIQWNCTDQQGNLVPAGIYFYQLQAGDFIQTKKMVLLR
ncbi:MAG: T9SS type A sorting domain-containing protein [Planctomycetia bacterium]|nr:T9SS type A sorting domain-containing protein [Planctomycetia bacterium]